MKKINSVLGLALAMVCLGSSNMFAQATASATHQGTVMDKSGAVVPGAEVKVRQKETGLIRTATTSNAGSYRFDLLPPGKCEVRVTAKGFATAAFENVELAVGQTTTVDATIGVSQQSEVVTVEASALLVDVQKTDVS